MRIAAISRVDMVVDPARASAEFHMHTRKLQASILVGLSALAIAGLLLPVALIVADAITNPQITNTFADHPGSIALLSAGIAVGLGLLTFPLRSGLARLNGEASIEMADGMVRAEHRGLLTTQTWSEPLAKFCGVTHHIRATLSGARHEIILVHPEPAKDILLHLANRHPQEGADHFARLLGLPELQPRVLYNSQRQPPAPAKVIKVPDTSELQAKAA